MQDLQLFHIQPGINTQTTRATVQGWGSNLENQNLFMISNKWEKNSNQPELRRKKPNYNYRKDFEQNQSHIYFCRKFKAVKKYFERKNLNCSQSIVSYGEKPTSSFFLSIPNVSKDLRLLTPEFNGQRRKNVKT